MRRYATSARRVCLLGLLVVVVPAPAAPAAALIRSGRWHLTTYYTAVASLHHGSPVSVRGCSVRDCRDGQEPIGTYPSDFVDAVRDEGTGRIDVGPYADHYLEWSDDVGFWLDSVPLDAHGGRLVPFTSAAADPTELRFGQSFRVTFCGWQEGQALPAAVCTRVRAATWRVTDAFTPGLGGNRHVDLYIGEESGEAFTETSPMYFDSNGAWLTSPSSGAPFVPFTLGSDHR